MKTIYYIALVLIFAVGVFAKWKWNSDNGMWLFVTAAAALLVYIIINALNKKGK